MWMLLGPLGAAGLTWELMLAKTPPVLTVMSFEKAAGPTAVTSIWPAVAVLIVNDQAPLGGGLLSSAPWVTSEFVTVKAAVSYVSIRVALCRPRSWPPWER